MKSIEFEEGYLIGITHHPSDYYLANVGFISGKKITSHTPTLEAIRQDWNIKGRGVVFHHDAQAVVLRDGIFAYHFPPICGANCLGAYGRVV
jgi:hypothetical protein